MSLMNKLKGFFGEYQVKRIIKKTNINKEYYVINDLRFYDNDKSVQIDHVVISEKFILCIETKNYSGMIFGNENQYQWTQTLNYGKVKNKFYNPVKQNHNHIVSLKNIIDKNDINIENIVVFTNKANISKVKDIEQIYTLKKLKKRLKSKASNDISAKQIYDILFALKQGKKISNKEHVKNIESRNIIK